VKRPSDSSRTNHYSWREAQASPPSCLWVHPNSSETQPLVGARFVILLYALLRGDLVAGAGWGSMEAGRNLLHGSRTAASQSTALTVQKP
jgi:hypothetical protein